jgi:serine/threonine-protein kinase RsbW
VSRFVPLPGRDPVPPAAWSFGPRGAGSERAQENLSKTMERQGAVERTDRPDPTAPEGVERRGGAEVTAPDVELHLRADPESVGVARQVVSGVGDCIGLDEHRLSEVALAVTEACTNVVMHAYPDGGGRYEMRVWAQQHRLVVAVRDHGQGISPRVPSAKAGLGLGLSLMLATCDEVSFARGGEAVTEVRMTFRLDEEAA